MEFLRCGTLNCRGIGNDLKQKQLATDMEDYNLDILCIQETHIQGQDVVTIESLNKNRNRYKLYNSGSNLDKKAGVGIIVRENFECTFTNVSERLCFIRCKISNINYIIISAYAHTLPKSEKKPTDRIEFYEKLESLIQCESATTQILIGGDFNAKTGSGHNDFPENIGKFGKGEINSNGSCLLEFCNRNGLFLTNTFFQHKLAHRVTWTCPEKINKNKRKNPIRNQIDYILTRNQIKHNITDSRSYSGTFVESDHNLVLTKIMIPKKAQIFKYQKKKETDQFNIENLENSDVSETYCKKFEEKIVMENALYNDNPDQWSELIKICQETSKDVLGFKKKKQKNCNLIIEELSRKQKKLRLQMNSNLNKAEKIKLKSERNKIMHEIQYKLKEERNKQETNKIKTIENAKDDSSKMFQAMRIINKDKHKEKIILKENEELITNENVITDRITNFFKDIFSKPNGNTKFDQIEPMQMKKTFTAIEVENAIRKLKNNKSAGSDLIHAEQLKHGPKILYSCIANIYNNIAKTGKFPSEIKKGILIPLHKNGKEKGKIENLRPIILLNMIRKILAIIMITRIYDKIDAEIPVTQTAYRPGRSTTENVFTFKVLTEKAICTSNYEINILLLDMSKAFDSINRDILIEDLAGILDEDELHILKILIEDVSLQVRNGKTLGESFTTNIGVPQGDCLSPVLFTLYLANALKKQNSTLNFEGDHETYACVNIDSEKLLPIHLQDHNYDTKTNKIKMFDQQYADDISWIGNSKQKLSDKEEEVTKLLANRNLKINKSKTENICVSKKGTDEWKNCKYLGSYFDTVKDVCHRKKMSMATYQKYKTILQSKKISLVVRMRIFNAYIASIFLYNSELWTITKKIGNDIDIFQRNLLRKILKIRYPFIITNENLYKRTNEYLWTEKIKIRRLRWTGHLLRLPEKAPAKLALDEMMSCNKTYKKIIGLIGKRQ